MKRREFIKDLALGSLLLKFQPDAFAQGQKFPDLAWIQGESPAQITKEAISSLGGIQQLSLKETL